MRYLVRCLGQLRARPRSTQFQVQRARHGPIQPSFEPIGLGRLDVLGLSNRGRNGEKEDHVFSVVLEESQAGLELFVGQLSADIPDERALGLQIWVSADALEVQKELVKVWSSQSAGDIAHQTESMGGFQRRAKGWQKCANSTVPLGDVGTYRARKLQPMCRHVVCQGCRLSEASRALKTRSDLT